VPVKVWVLRVALGCLGGGLLVAFGLGYASAYLPPDPFWWTAPFAAALPLTGAAVGLLAAAGMVAALRRRRVGWGLAATAGLALLVARFGVPGWGAPSASARAQPTLSLLTYNVPTLSRSNPSLVTVLQRADADLIALQEIAVRSAKRPGVQYLPRALRAVVDSTDHRLPGLPRSTLVSQPVLGRLALDSLGVERLPSGSAPQSVTRVPFEWQGRRAVLYNIHLHTVFPDKPWEVSRSTLGSWSFWQTFWSGYRRGIRQRAAQARHIRRLVEAESVPVIVAGDFNSTPHDWAYRHLAASLQDAYRASGAFGGGTYPASRPLVRIDHVLVSDAWEVVDADILEAQALSDHRPLLARLRWKASP